MPFHNFHQTVWTTYEICSSNVVISKKQNYWISPCGLRIVSPPFVFCCLRFLDVVCDLFLRCLCKFKNCDWYSIIFLLQVWWTVRWCRSWATSWTSGQNKQTNMSSLPLGTYLDWLLGIFSLRKLARLCEPALEDKDGPRGLCNMASLPPGDSI